MVTETELTTRVLPGGLDAPSGPARHRGVPRRFRADPAWAGSASALLRTVVGASPDPDDTESEALARALLQRDEPAATLVRAVRESHSVTMGQIRTALEKGIEAVPDPPQDLVQFFAAVEDRPAWVDEAMLARGARACRRAGPDIHDILAYGSLLSGYRTAGPLGPLVSSGRLSGDSTRRRVGETSKWWVECVADNGMDRFGEGFALSVHVRIMHAFINYHHEHDPEWDWALRGTPINQYDQAGTLGLFSTTFLLQTRMLGIAMSPTDREAVMHLWSYVGWLMGLDDQWLPRTEDHGRRVMYHILSTSNAPDRNSVDLAAALLDVPRHYPVSPRRREYERQRALSTATFFQGLRGMRELGLPLRLPWYPLWRIAVNTVWFRVIGNLPAGKQILQHRGDRTHASRLGYLFPRDETPRVGPTDPHGDPQGTTMHAQGQVSKR
ncbi:MAG: oxygenase MpaB family protein [Mycobacteriaceae bacterium]